MEKWDFWPHDPDIKVSTFGNIETIKHRWEHLRDWKPLNQHVNNSGYMVVSISRKGLKLVHRLVAETWLENPDFLPEINHIDGDKLNNNVSNLEWSTRSKNIKHAYDNNLRVGPSRMRVLVNETGIIYNSQLEAPRS